MNDDSGYRAYLDTALSFEERAEDLLSRLTVGEKALFLIEAAPANERLGIPKYHHGNEALHGVLRPGKYTVFPQAIGLGATFDEELIRRMASAISDEARAVHHHGRGTAVDADAYDNNGLLTFWSPDLNLCRDPRWGRTGETYGEDPYLAGRMGVAFVRGMQGDDPKYLKTVSTPKHFTANNEEHNRFSCNARMSRKTLFEYHMEPFRMAVQEGKCASLMAAYNAVNGIPCHENKELLTDILRGEWGFDGYVVSDCSAIARLRDSHKRYTQPEDAAAAAMNAGVDLECGGYPPYVHYYAAFLEQNVRDGTVSAERLDEACRRVLLARFRLGMFDPPEAVPYSRLPLSVVGCPEHQALARQCARESVVLLKNNGILPLDHHAKLAVIGNNADVCQFGDYSGTPYNEPVTPLDGIRAAEEDVSFTKWNYSAGDSYQVITGDLIRDENGKPGLTGRYYANAAFEGNARVRTDAAVDFAWNDHILDTFIDTEAFSVRWTGTLCPAVSGMYTIRLDYAGAIVCERPFFSIDGRNCGIQTTMYLEGGKAYPLTVEYRKREEKPRIRLEWIVPADENAEPFARECALAAECDRVIAVIGLGNALEHEGIDKQTLDLPSEQTEMLRRVAAVNPNLIVVLENGSPVTIPELHTLSAALVEAWYPGEQGGAAIADVLFGDYVPAGRLCASFPVSADDLPPFNDYEMSHGRTYMYNRKPPMYPFGFGLSYTRFAYDALRVRWENDICTVTAAVTNTGKYAGDEVVQVYLDSAGLEGQPMYRLVGFRRLRLAPGETAEAAFSLDRQTFALFDEDGRRSVYGETYTVYVGGALPTERARELGAAEPIQTVIRLTK